MEDIACMSLYEKFPWLMTFCNKFCKGYVDEQDLLKNLKSELDCISAIGKKRQEELFKVIRSLFLHFWWRMRWKQDHTWKKYWKKEGIETERNDDDCKLIAKLLEFVIYTGIILSKGNINSPWIMNIMQIVRLLPDYDDILCTSLLSLSVMKKYRPAYIAILKSVLIFNIPQYVTEPVTFIKIMMLFKKLKMLIRDKNERILLMASAKKFQGPPCLISWISSFDLDVSKIQQNKISQQLLKKSCKGLLKNLKSVIEDQEILAGAKRPHSSSTFCYISDYSTDFENQLKRDVQNDMCCQKEIKREDSISVNSPQPICDLDGSIDDYSFNTEVSSSVCLFCDKTTHEEVCLKKSVIIENKDNHMNDNDSSSLFPFVDHVLCDKKETITKTNEKGRKTKLVNKTSVIHKNHDCLGNVSTTSTPEVDSAYLSLSKDSSMKSESDHSNLIMTLSEKFPESCDIHRNNQKKRKIEYDENTSMKKFASKKNEDVSVILETNQVYSDSLPSISLPMSKASIAEDVLHDSHLIPDLNMFDDVALSVSNGHGISKIKGDFNKVNTKNSPIALPSNVSKNVTKCDVLEKSDKFIKMTKTKCNKPAPVNVKRYKLYNPDAIDHYKLSETESGTASSTLDSTSVAVVQEKGESSYDNLAQYVLFDSDSEFGDIFSKPSDIPLYDYSSDVERLLKDIPEKETFPVNDEESIQLLVNSIVEKVSSHLDNANLAKQTTNNFNVFLDKIHHDQQLELTLEKLHKDLDDIAAHLTRCPTNDSSIENQILANRLSNESSFSNDILSENVSLDETAMTENFQLPSFSTCSQLSSSDGQWCGSLNQSTLTINCNLSDIGSNDSQININPIDSLVPLKIVINLNKQKSAISQRHCFESNFHSSVPSNCSSNNVIHFHGTYSRATSTSHSSDERQSFSPSHPSVDERQSFSPSHPSVDERQSFPPSHPFIDETQLFSPSHTSVDETQFFSPSPPSVDETQLFSPSHSSVDETLFFSPSHSSVDEREAFSPSLISHEEPQKYDDQPTEHKSTESIRNSPNFIQGAEIYSGCDNSSLDSVDYFSKCNETTTCNSPLWEVPNAEANQGEVERGAPSLSSSLSPSPSYKSVASGKCNEEIDISVDESAITNIVEYKSKLRPRNKTCKPDFLGISKDDLLSDSERDTKRKKRKEMKKKPSCNTAANISNSKNQQPEQQTTKNQQRNVSELDTQGEVISKGVTNVPTTHGTVWSKNTYVVQWLIKNYETAEDVKLSRTTVYSQYQRYCKIHRRKWILSYSSFNKIVQSVFDGVQNLGERYQWKYFFGLRKKPVL